MQIDGKETATHKINEAMIALSWTETQSVNKQELMNAIAALEKNLAEKKALLDEFGK